MTVGLIDADSGEQILREGKADIIGINRRFFADPDWANKVRDGHFGGYPAMHALWDVQHELQQTPVLPHQCVLRDRKLSSETGDEKEARGSGGRSCGDAGGAGGGDAGAPRDAF